MIELTSKQKKHLRGLGQQIKPLAAIGKGGLSEALQRNITKLLDQHELVKVNIPAGERQATADQLAADTGAVLVGLVGRMVLLYRPNSDLPPNRRIELPE